MINVSKRRHLLAGLAAVLLLTSSMTVASVAVAEAATQRQSLDAYFKAGLNYCVAEALGAYWQVSPDRAKVMAGDKILRGDRVILSHVIKTARRGRSCVSGFLMDDTKSVADLWTQDAAAAV